VVEILPEGSAGILRDADPDPELIIRGGDGNDSLWVDAAFEGDVIVDGGAGNDLISGSSAIYGGPGNDVLTGKPGNNTFDGGDGRDIVVIQGTPDSDAISVTQISPTTLTHTIGSLVGVDTVTDVESFRIEAGDGNDTVRISHADGLSGGSLPITVIGGAPHTGDLLEYLDDGPGDMIVQRQGADDRSGTLTVGDLAPVAYEQVGHVRILPLNSFTGTTGGGTTGNLVVFKHDDFEHNNAASVATFLGAGRALNVDPLIDPAGDEDWYQFVAERTGTLDTQAYFRQRAGLPGGGDLQAEIYDSNLVSDELPLASGTPTLDAAGNVIGARITIPVVRNQTYYLRVRGATPEAINTYSFVSVNLAAPVPGPVDLTASSDSGLSAADTLTNNSVATFEVLLDDDQLDEFLNLDLAPDTTDNDTADADFDYGVEMFNNNVPIGFAFYTGSGNNWRFNAGPGDLLEGDNNFLSAAVWIHDRATPSVRGRGKLSDSLQVTLDQTAPAQPGPPDLLPSSDSGTDAADNVTNISSPAFAGLGEDAVMVRLFTQNVVTGEVQLVGQSTVNSDESDSNLDDSGTWEITSEPLSDGVYDVTIELEDAAGNLSERSTATRIEIDTLPPNRPFLDLVESDDSGRHDDDNVTNVAAPTVTMTTTDRNVDFHNAFQPGQEYLKYRVFQRFEEHAEVLLYDSASDAQIGGADGFTRLELLAELLTQQAGSPLDDGVHNLKLEVEDRAGNISHSFSLDLLIDTVAPVGSVALSADSDSGIAGAPQTNADRVTSDRTPAFFGTTEADAVVRIEVDGIAAGTAVAIPVDGDDAFSPPDGFEANYVLDTVLNLADGEHEVVAFFRDVAGNESNVTATGGTARLSIFTDTAGPRVTNLTDGRVSTDGQLSVFDGTASLFEPKPAGGPDPLVHSIVVHLADGPLRTEDFLVDPLFRQLAEEEGNYRLVGDASGDIPILRAVPVFRTETGQPAVAQVELVFHDLGPDQIPFTADDGLGGPLPDDRYTLWVSDTVRDPAGNGLDGESGSRAPFEGQDAPVDTPPTFPTGDRSPGGDFAARFTVDSRPEIATYLGDGTWYVDLNGNGVFDPGNTDFTNRDIVWRFGTRGDSPVVGDWNGDGYDEIGVLGSDNRFRLDFDGNGAFQENVDVSFTIEVSGTGTAYPMAGDWDGDGSDEVALQRGSSWFIDDTGAEYTPALTNVSLTRISTGMKGLAIVGDWDGDGDDNVGTFDGDVFFLDINDSFDEAELTVTFPEFDFGGLDPQPVAGDWDQDGSDDLGLFVRRETGANSGAREAGEWFLDVNTKLSDTGVVFAEFEPPLTGIPGVPFVNQDIFYNFGDERESTSLGGLIPVSGNFDPPIIPRTREALAGDANLDGHVRFADFVLLSNNFGRQDALWSDGDFDRDGRVEFSDFTILANNFGRSRQPLPGDMVEGSTFPPISSIRPSTATEEIFAELEVDKMFWVGGLAGNAEHRDGLS
jgi:hypothetical protein